MSYFDTAFEIVIGVEQGYVNNPDDPGKATKFGVSQKTYPKEDIASLTLERAKFLYRRDFWESSWDALPWHEALCAFDCAVLQGQGRASKWLQLTSGKPQSQFIQDFQAERTLQLASQPTFVTFGRGWMRRLFHIAQLAEKSP
jgi:lysozyme family protein